MPLALVAVVTLTQALGDPARAWLRFDRADLAAGQWWRVITCSFVHLGWYHWLLNVLALVAWVMLCPGRVPAWSWALRLTLLSAGMSAGLYVFAPHVDTYVGLSGVMHGLFVLGLWPLIARRDLIATGCLVFLVGKIAWELFAGAPVSDEASIGGRVVTESHLFGTLAALVYGLVARMLGQSGET